MTDKETTLESTLPEREQAILDTALLESDQLLARSLHDDDQRRRRRIWLLVLLFGGVVMSVLILAIAVGWLSLVGPVAAEIGGESTVPATDSNSPSELATDGPEASITEFPGLSDEQWQERLLSTKQTDRWNVGAEIGTDLVHIPGDRPFKILKAHWKNIPSSVAKQILKGFTPGMMGNEGIHARFFDVMHLGMMDPNPGVRQFAAGYIEMQGLPNFENDAKGYGRWRKENAGRSAQQVVDLAKPARLGSGDNGETLSAAGWELWKQRKYSEAAEKFTAAVKADPQATNAWNGLGWSQFNGGDSVQAVAAFEKCVALEPKHPAALNGLGQIYLMWKEYDRAEKYLLLAAPHAPAAWYGLARLYLLQNKFEEAQPWAEKIAAQNPTGESAQRMLAAAAAGKLDDGYRRQLEPAGKPTANSADAVRGWAMFQQGKMSTAERLFRRALTEDAENLSALNGLAFCLLNLGKHELAQPLFEKYLALDQEAAGPMNGLARCLKASGQVDEAIALWERMAKKYPGPTAAASGLATTYLEQKKYAKAVEYFQILADSDATNKRYQNGLKRAQAGLAESP